MVLVTLLEDLFVNMGSVFLTSENAHQVKQDFMKCVNYAVQDGDFLTCSFRDNEFSAIQKEDSLTANSEDSCVPLIVGQSLICNFHGNRNHTCRLGECVIVGEIT